MTRKFMVIDGEHCACYSMESLWHIQEQAVIALEAGKFNFKAAVDFFVEVLPEGDNGQIEVEIPNDAEEMFNLLLDLFCDNRLNLDKQIAFVEALEAGMNGGA